MIRERGVTFGVRVAAVEQSCGQRSCAEGVVEPVSVASACGVDPAPLLSVGSVESSPCVGPTEWLQLDELVGAVKGRAMLVSIGRAGVEVADDHGRSVDAVRGVLQQCRPEG